MRTKYIQTAPLSVKKQILLFLLFFCVAGIAKGNTYNVTQTTDGNATNQLRGAILAADAAGAGPHTINVAAGTYNLTLGQITFGNNAQNISIIGAGSNLTIVNMTATGQDRIFLINPTATVANVQTIITGIKFTNGYLTSDDYGGGAMLCGGPSNTVNISNCIFENNTASSFPGGGAICNSSGGAFNVQNCTFTNNKVLTTTVNSSSTGGAITVLYAGSTIPITGSCSITDCNFTGNYCSATFAASGGAVYLSADYSTTSTSYSFNIQKNKFNNNHADTCFSGGAGGGIYISSSFAANINYNVFQYNYVNANTSESLGSSMFASGTISAINNWWNCNGDPQTTGTCGEKARLIGTVGSGTLATTPYLVLRTTAASGNLCPSNYSTNITSGFLTNSSNNTISVSNLSHLVGLPITFSATNGTLSSAQTTIQSNGTATANYTASGSGSGSVSGLVGNLTTSDVLAKATISAGANPTISLQPSSITGCPGGTVSMSVTAGSSNTAISYQWYVGTTPLVNNSIISGVTTNTLTFTNPVAANNATNYNVVVSNGCGSITSNNVSLSLFGSHIYVVPGGTGQGSSWADAAGDINAAMVVAAGCSAVSEIWVKAGTYKPSGLPYPGTFSSVDSRDRSFYLLNNVTIYGGFAGTETTVSQRNPALNATILSGDIGTVNNESDNCYHVINSISNNATAKMDGFVITGGNANLSGSSATINGANIGRYMGGGICITASSPVISNCVFTNNKANSGGGAYVYNTCTPAISNCVFALNAANENGGGLFSGFNSNSTISNCTIWGNSSVGGGGGMYSFLFSAPNIFNTIIWGNTTTSGNASVEVNFSTPNINYSIVQNGYGSNLSSDPMFTNTANPIGADNIWMSADDGLQIMPSSPAFNAGTATGASLRDILGTVRPFLGGIDIGAYENVVTPLPLTLVSFWGTWENQNALLQWETANEEDIDYFTVLRSEDGKTFAGIGKVRAIGGSNTYRFKDVAAVDGANFYKLEITGKSKSLGYSNIVMLNKKQFFLSKPVIYPNPAKSLVTIKSELPDSKGHLVILDNLGRIMYETQTEASAVELDVSFFSSGSYNVFWQQEAGIQKGKLLIEK